MAKKRYRQSKIMRHFSMLAGPIRPGKPESKVTFRSLLSYDRLAYRVWTRIVAWGALLLVIAFGIVVYWPSHWVAVHEPKAPTHLLNILMLACVALLQIFILVGTFSAARSTLKARNPIPMRTPKGLRVAFATTRAPGEPVSMVRRTLQAAKHIHYSRGTVDVWLLDETNDSELKKLCKTLDVNYFTRAGIPEWNSPAPKTLRRRLADMLAGFAKTGKLRLEPRGPKQDKVFAARSKHGNFNAWGEYQNKLEHPYDIIAAVDTDHVPEPNFLERLLGYFNDPDVAYVVGPQVYGNYGPGMKGLVVRWAESQASFFQSTIQRAGNATNSPMFVGTNYAVRTNVLAQIGGYKPYITEDMATGLAIHAARNPETGKRWKSVYTPDVLAIGEGPDYWAPYFSQQWRWAAGTFDTWKRMVWKMFFKLSHGARLHYFLMLTFYPITAITWLLGIISSMTYLLTGATAILAPWNQFISLYLMSIVMQMGLYFWNRRYNVSPHEPMGTYGVAGMAITTLTAPVYLSALTDIVLGKKPHFVVTTKGSSKNPDSLQTFHLHLKWAVILLAGVAFGLTHNHHHPAMLIWVGMQLVVCLLPPVLGMSVVWRDRIRSFRRHMNRLLKRKQIVLEGEQHAA